MGFSDNEGQPGNFAEQYASRRESHLSTLQLKEEEMRQKFVIRVKEKESELKEAEREVGCILIFGPCRSFGNHIIYLHLTSYLLSQLFVVKCTI